MSDLMEKLRGIGWLANQCWMCKFDERLLKLPLRHHELKDSVVIPVKISWKLQPINLGFHREP